MSITASIKAGTVSRSERSKSNASLQTIESQTQELEEGKRRRWTILEIVVVTTIIVIIVGLSSLPVLFFYIRETGVPENMDGNTTIAAAMNQCASPVTYTGDICSSELLSVMECFPDNSLMMELQVVSVSSQEQAQTLIGALEQLGSPECIAAAVPFLCVYLFQGVCDEDKTHYFPTAGECQEISNGVCQEEFRLARSFGIEIVDCATLPAGPPSLCANSSLDNVRGRMDENDTSGFMSSGNCTLTCSEDFFCDERTLQCIPLCPDWTLFSSSTASALDTTVLFFAPLGMLAGIGVLVVSFIRWKKVFVFPSVLVIYQTIALLILILFHIITYFDRGYLYCSSPNLLESILNSTSYCVITGMLIHYIILQVNIWWVVHTVTILWKIYFPIQARALYSESSTRRLRVLHITCVLVALLLPLVPVVIPIIGNAITESQSDGPVPGTLGFGSNINPPILCSGVDADITFYTLILPNVLLIMLGTISLVLAIWKIHKEQGLFHTSMIPQSKSLLNVSTAEKKLVIVFCYYIFLQVIAFVTFSVTQQVSDTLQTELFSYFICEQNGNDPSNPCSRSGFEGLINPVIILLSYVLAMFAPAVNFVFVVDYKETKQKLKSLCMSMSKT